MIAIPSNNGSNGNGKDKKASPKSGGLGGEVSPDNGARDTRLIEKAVRKGWKLPEGLMDELPAALRQVAMNKKASHRNRIAASRVLVTMHGQNQADDPASQKHEHSGLIDLRAIRDQLTQDNEQLDSFGRSANGDGEPRAICPPGESG